MRLELDEDGIECFDRWRLRPSTSLWDVQTVSRLLVEYSEQRGWQNNWVNYRRFGDPNIIVVEARDGLFVHIVRYTGDDKNKNQFSIAYIGEDPGLEDAGGGAPGRAHEDDR